MSFLEELGCHFDRIMYSCCVECIVLGISSEPPFLSGSNARHCRKYMLKLYTVVNEIVYRTCV